MPDGSDRLDEVNKNPPRRGWQPYHHVWLWLFLAWMLLYADRSITGPVVNWMIVNDVSFLSQAPMPHALGGIIGSMFFAGYMLTQFPAGFLGDRYGSKVLILISVVWSGIATFLSGLTRELYSFVALRIFTGLGEGAYYSNDRAIVYKLTPEGRRGLGMGVVFVGLAAGLTIATLLTPPLLDFASSIWGKDSAWSFPFLLFSIPTLLIALGIWRFVRIPSAKGAYRKALARLLSYSAIFLVALMTTYLLTVNFGLGVLFQAVAVLLTALLLIAFIFLRLSSANPKLLRDRDLLVMYVSAIPLLYTLWFFGFWVLLVVSEASELGLSGAAVYAALFGVANALGYPIGGRIYDRLGRTTRRGKRVYSALAFGVALLVFLLAVVITTSKIDVLVLGCLVFLIGFLFAAAQTVHMTLTADLSPSGQVAQTFGMWNLVAEVGAVLSPVLSGALRDLTGDWTLAVLVDGGLLMIGAFMVLLVRNGHPRQHTSAN